MNIAHIVPPPWMLQFPQTLYRFTLAHWALKYPDALRLFRGSGKNSYVILDNGSFEDEQVSVTDLNEAVSIVGPDEVVLPDILGDSKRSLVKSWAALGQVAANRVMFVVQARTIDDWQRCLEAWLNKWESSNWGLTYGLTLGVNSLRQSKGREAQFGTRWQLIEKAVETGYPIHLLGLRDIKAFVEKELPVARQLGVRGIDTSTAFALAIERQILTSETKKIPLKDPKEYASLAMWARRLVFLNIAILNNWVTNPDPGRTDAIPTALIRHTAQRWLTYWAEGFEDLSVVMAAVGMRPGRYALLRRDSKEVYVRPLTTFQKPTGLEELVTIKEYVRK